MMKVGQLLEVLLSRISFIILFRRFTARGWLISDLAGSTASQSGIFFRSAIPNCSNYLALQITKTLQPAEKVKTFCNMHN